VWGVGRREASSELRLLDGHVGPLVAGMHPATLAMRVIYRSHFKFRKTPKRRNGIEALHEIIHCKFAPNSIKIRTKKLNSEASGFFRPGRVGPGSESMDDAPYCV
jgi:hypothetical protein